MKYWYYYIKKIVKHNEIQCIFFLLQCKENLDKIKTEKTKDDNGKKKENPKMGLPLIPYTCLTISRSLSPSKTLSGVSFLSLSVSAAATVVSTSTQNVKSWYLLFFCFLPMFFHFSLNLCSQALYSPCCFLFLLCCHICFVSVLTVYAAKLVFVIHGLITEKWVCLVSVETWKCVGVPIWILTLFLFISD